MAGDPALRDPGAELSALGTTARLLVTDPAVLRPATQELARRLDRLDRACSRFRPDSELRRLDGRDGLPMPISPLFAELVEVAVRAAEDSQGDVDPTVGAAMAAVGYDRDYLELPPDGPPVPLVPVPVPGWRVIRLDRERCRVTVPGGVRLDLGATARAWAADDAARGLARRFGGGVLVGLGGDVATGGPAPSGGWSLRVQEHLGRGHPPAEPSAVVALRTGGVATSSRTARCWRRGGTVLHHLLDPRTGLPARTGWRMVSVAAASCLEANVASLSVMVGGERAVHRLRDSGLPARLVALDGTVTTLNGWPPSTPPLDHGTPGRGVTPAT